MNEVDSGDIHFYINKMRVENISIPSRMWPMSSRNSSTLLELILASLILGLKIAIDREEKDENKRTCGHIPNDFYFLLVDTYSSYLIFYMYNETFNANDDLRELRGRMNLCCSMLATQDGQKWGEDDEADLEEVLEKIFFSGGLTHFFSRDHKMNTLKQENRDRFKPLR
jgi:hypothetical protein